MNKVICVVTFDGQASVWETPPRDTSQPHTLESAREQADSWIGVAGFDAAVYVRVDNPPGQE